MAKYSPIAEPLVSTHITPIACSFCGDTAHLMRRMPAVTGDGRGEIRTFECIKCRGHTEMFIPE